MKREPRQRLKLSDRYLNQPIRKKLLILFLSAFFLIGTAIFVTLIFIYQDISSQTLTMTSKTLSLYTEQMNELLEQLSDYSMNLMFDQDMQDKLEVLNETSDSYEQLNVSSSLNDKLFMAASSLPYVDHIDLVTVSNIRVSSAPERTAGSGASFGDLREITTKNGECVWSVGSYPYGKESLIMSRLVQTINNNFMHTPLGVITFYVDLSALTDTGALSEDFYPTCFIIADSSGRVLYQSEENSIFYPLETMEELSGQDGINSSYFISTADSLIPGWNYCLLLPREAVLGRIIRLTVTLAAAYGVLICFCIAVCLRLSRKITLPLSMLSQEMDRVAKGNFEVNASGLIDCTARDELRTMCRHFIDMTNQLKALITENYEVKLLNKDAQLRALQAQIDPHFLYNALDSVNWLAKLAGEKQISTIAQSLAALMRQTLDTSKKDYFLKDELDLLDNYVAIQQIRYGNRLEFSKNTDDSLLSITVPKLILQPLLENSVRYALESMDGVCRIKLDVCRDGTDCLIRVSDNGPGIPDENVPLILNGTIRTKGNGVGIKNVNDRLKLIYPGSEPLHISKAAGGGTLITIRIPPGDGRDIQNK